MKKRLLRFPQIKYTLYFVFIFLLNTSGFAQTNGDYQSIATGTPNWSSASSWLKRVGGVWTAATDYPGQNALTNNALVTILSGVTLTIDVSPPNALENLTVNGVLNGSTAAVTSFTVNKNLIVGNGRTFDLKKTSLVVAGTTTLANTASTILTDTDPEGSNSFVGLVTINANASFSAVQSPSNFQGGISNSGTFNTSGGCSFSGSQSLTGSGPFTFLNATVAGGTLTCGSAVTVGIGGNLEVNAGAFFNASQATLTVSGTTTLAGTFQDNNATGTNRFIGATTVASGGAFTTTSTSTNTFQGALTNNGSVASTGAATFQAGITNNNTFSITGLSTFSATQTLLGSNNYSFAAVTVSSGTLTCGSAVNVGMSGALIVSSGSILDASQSTLLLTGTSNMTGGFRDTDNGGANSFGGLVTIAATTGSFAPISSSINTFQGGITNNNTTSGSFSVSGPTLFSPAGSINVAGAGAYLFGGNVTVSSGTLQTTNNSAFTVNGDLGISGGAIYNANAATLAVSGTTTVQGTLSDNNAGSGTNTFTGAVTVSGTGIINALASTTTFLSTVTNNNAFSTSGTTTFHGTVTNSGTINSAGPSIFRAGITNNGIFAVTGLSTFPLTQSLLGTNNYSFAGLTVSGGALTCGSAVTIAVAGNLIINSGVVLDVSQSAFSVTGTSTVTGTLNDGNTTGSNSFGGVVTIAATTGFFNASSSSSHSFQGGIVNNNSGAGSFNVTGPAVFNPAGVITTSGAGAFIFGSHVTVVSGTLQSSNSTAFTINGNLGINSGATFNSNSSTLSVVGTTTVAGILSDNNAGLGTNTFNGPVIVSASTGSVNALASVTIFASTVTNNNTFSTAGTTTFQGMLTNAGTFSSTGTSVFQAGIVNNGTFSPSGACTFLLNPQTLGGSNPFNFNNATFGQPADALTTYTATTNLNVSGTLTFVKGIINLGSNLLTATGTVSGASGTAGWANGNMAMNFALGTNVSKTFTVGDLTNYAPATILFPSVTTAGLLTVTTTGNDQVQLANSCINPSKRVKRVWTLSNNTVAPLSFNPTFSFPAGDIQNSANTAVLIGGKYTTSIWTYPTVGTRTGASTQLTGVTSLGDFQLGEPLLGPAGSITGAPIVCAGQTGYLYSVNIPNATNYNWTVPLGASIVSGTNTSTVTIDYSGSAANGNITLSASTSVPACSATTTASLAIQVSKIINNSIGGSQSVCTGQSPINQFTGSTPTGNVGALVYAWQSSITSSTGPWSPATGTNNAITYNPTATAFAQTTWFQRAVTDAGSCAAINAGGPIQVAVFASAPGTPSVFGSGEWICYGYGTTGLTGYRGFYTEPSLSFDTRNRYANGVAISSASGYQGCLTPATSMSVSMKRTNITPGIYQVNIDYQDDGFVMLVNGNIVFQNNLFNNTLQTNVWTGLLTATDNVELQWVQGGSGSALKVTFIPVTPAATLLEGSISGNQTLCTGQIPQAVLANVTTPTSGCTILPNGYQWQTSTDSSTWTNVLGANGLSYTVPSGVSETAWYRRQVRDQCRDSAVTSPVKIAIDDNVYGDPAEFGSNQWNFYTYTGYNNFSNYAGYYVETGNSFATTSRYASTRSPSFASGYKGCQVPVSNFTVSAKRNGIIGSTTGVFQIDLASLDDVGSLYIDGNLVYSRGCCVASPVTNIWTGPLDTNSDLEWRWLAAGSPNNSALTLTELAIVPTGLLGGSINGDQTLCSGDIPSVGFGSLTPASGACSMGAYKWQKSTDGGTVWSDLANSSSLTYIPVQSIFVETRFRRVATDLCNNVAYSNVITVSISNTYPGDPTAYGNNQWNIYAYDDNNFGLYVGYYVNPNMTFDTRLGQTHSDAYSYSTNLPTSAAPGYLGCQQTSVYWSAWAKRQGVSTPGYYQIDIPYHDDYVYLLVNGVSVFQHLGCCDPHANTWTGYLDASSLIDLKWMNNAGPGAACIRLNYLGAVPPGGLTAGTLDCNPTNYCATDYPIINSMTPATGGCYVNYQWQASSDGLSWSNISGATSLGYNSVSPLVSATYYRRAADDACSNPTVYTPTCYIMETPPPTAPTYGNGVWNNLVYNTTNFSSGYTGYYTEPSLSFATTSQFSAAAAPSTASSFVGCQLGPQNYSIRMLRTGFASSSYQVDIPDHDDNAYLIINGATVFQHLGCCDVHTNVWTGNLGPTDQVELRYLNNGGSGSLQATFTQVALSTPLTAGVVAGNQSICNGVSPVAFTQTTPASSMCNLILSQWQSSADNVSFTNIMGATSSTYAPGSLTQTTYYRRVDADACGRTANTNVLTVTVSPAINPGTVGANQTLCNGATAATLTELTAASGGNGSFTYQWQSSTDNITFANIGGATLQTFAPGVIAATRYYRRTALSCGGSTNSPSVSVTVSPATAITMQPLNYSDCTGALASFTVVAVGSGLTYQWEQSTNGGTSYAPISGAFTNTYSIPITSAMILNLYRYRAVVSATCAPTNVTSSVATLNSGNPTFTTQPANTTTCTNGNASFTLVASGSGLTYQWRVSTNGGVSFSDIVNGGVYSGATSATLQLTSVLSSYTTYRYQCNVTTTQCGTPTASGSAILTVQPSISGNTLSVAGSATICSGTNKAITGTVYATLTGGGGTSAASYTHQWQSSVDNISFNPISGATAANYTTPVLSQTTFYRRLSSTVACNSATANTSASQEVTVLNFNTQPTSVTACAGSSIGFSVSTSVPSPNYQWQEFNGTAWSDILTSNGPNATGATYSNYNSSTLALTGLTNALNADQYRCVVSHAGTSCNSSAATLTVLSLPTISVQPVNAATCSGISINLPVTATGSGLTYQWQLKAPASSSFTNVVNGALYQNATTASLTVVTPTISRDGFQYQVVVGGTCSPASTSNPMTLTVYAPLTSNAISSVQTICSGDTPAQLLGTTPSGGNGSFAYQWLSSTDGTNYSTITAATALNYQPLALTANTYYRRRATSSNCPQTTSSTLLISVDPPTGITTHPSTNVYTCPNSPANFVVSATGQNLSYKWEESTDNGSTWSTISNNVSYGGFLTPTLTVKLPTYPAYNGYQYRAVVSGDCGGGTSVVNSNAGTLNVYPSPNIVISPSSTSICAGQSTPILTASGANTFTWNPGNLSGSSQTLAPAATTIYTVVGANSTTTCTGSTTITVTVNPLPALYTVGTSGSFCAGGSGLPVSLSSSQVGVNYQLKIGSADTDAPVLGTGASLNFGNKVVAGNYSVLATNATTGCLRTMSSSAVISINPIPDVNQPSLQENCHSTSTALVNFTGSVGGTVYNWTNNALSIGLGSNGVGNIGSFIATNTSPSTVVATVNVTPSANGCIGASKSFTYSVYSFPVIGSQPLSQSKCIGTDVTFSTSATGSGIAFQWKKNGGDIPSAVSSTYPLTNLGLSDAANYTVTVSGTCSSVTSNVAVLAVGQSNTWTGTTNNDWFTTSNWECGILPNSGLATFIPNSVPTYPVIGAGNNGNVQNLTIASSASLTMGLGATLGVYGNWTDGGTFNAGNGTVVFSGPSSQMIDKIGASTTEKFYNLTINNTMNTVTVGSITDLEILANGTLLVSSGTFDLNSRRFVLRSGAPYTYGIHTVDSTARLGRIVGTLINTSGFAIERYIPTLPYNGFNLVKTRFIATPIQGVTARQWADSVSIMGGAVVDGFVQSPSWGNQNSTLLYYNEPSTAGNSNARFRSIMTQSTALNVGQGYALSLGYDAQASQTKYPAPRNYVILKMAGHPTVGSFSTNITKSGATLYGYNLVGNPYPCEIDWNSLWTANSSVVSSTMAILDPLGGITSGQHFYYNARTGKSIDPRYSIDSVSFLTTNRLNPSYISSSQAFFVLARNLGTSSLLFQESVKPLSNFRAVANFREDISTINIGITNGQLHDNTYLFFHEEAALANYDPDFDSYKLANTGLNISTNTFGNDLAMNGLSFTDLINIPIKISASAIGKFKLVIQGSSLPPSIGDLFLRDKYTGITKALSLDSLLIYSFDVTSDPASKGSRFLLFKPSVVTDTDIQFAGGGVSLYPNPVTSDMVVATISNPKSSTYTVEILDVNGVVIYQKNEVKVEQGNKLMIDALSEHLSAGVYMIKMISETEVFTKKLIFRK